MLDAVIFDMDGVLVDSEPMHYRTTNVVLGRRGAELPRPDYDRCLGMDEVAFFALLVERFGLDDDPADLARERVLSSMERLAVEALPPQPGVLELVLALRGEDRGLAVATSATAAQARLVLEKLGLTRTLGAIVSRDDVEQGKPAPDLFLEAARRLEVEPAACLVFEDAVHGVAAARAAGMVAVALPPPGDDGERHREAGAVEVLPSLAGLDVERLDALHAEGGRG